MKIHLLDIRPFDGIGPVKLGITRPDLRQVLNGPVTTFRVTEKAPTLSDQFLDHNAIAHYTEDDHLEAIEFYGGTIEWNGIQLLGRDAVEVYDEVKPHSRDVEFEAGVTFHDLGFALYAPGWGKELEDDDDNIVESVIVFRRMYYRQR